ncbi:MAG: ParA family protein, partial [Mollicutes bacterium PWAP]|nr:ParA family protein [Mollicutes bacterium PWAP]
MKTIAFLNNKGGVLKTTLTTNISGAIASNNKKVLILDTDPQSSVLSRFGRNGDDEKNNLSDLFRGDSKIEESIKWVYENKIGVISSDFSLSMLEVEITNGTIDSQNINKILNNIKTIASQSFDYLLIDCAPTFGRITNEVIKLTDEIVVPSSMEQDSFKGLTNLINVLKASNNESKLTYVVPTLFKSRTRLHNSMLEQWFIPLSNQENFKVSENKINDSIQASTELAISKLPLTLTKGRKRSKMVYFDLIKEM